MKCSVALIKWILMHDYFYGLRIWGIQKLILFVGPISSFAALKELDTFGKTLLLGQIRHFTQ